MLVTVCGASAQNVRTWSDPAGDVSTPRRTNVGANSSIASVENLPDLLEVRLSGWIPTDPAIDWYTGSSGAPGTYHILRLDAVFDGLVNPAGPVEIFHHDAQRYGLNPLTGYLELDLDADRDTGCALGDSARSTVLGNLGRFGGRSSDLLLKDRTPASNCDFDSGPEQRNGAEMRLSLCSCHTITLLSETGNGNGTMEAGETFITSSRYFEMMSGYISVGGYSGGPISGPYNPTWELRFSHDISTDQTTVSLVFPLDHTGYATLMGVAEEPMDFWIDNAVSVKEILVGLTDPLPVLGDEFTCSVGWDNDDPDDFLDPTMWDATAIFGTAADIPVPQPFVWTDVGFDHTTGDVTGDGIVDQADRDAVAAEILSTDGVACGFECSGSMRCDEDGVVDGIVTVPNLGENFSLFDINYDGFVDQTDLDFFDLCIGDWDNSGTVDVQDLLAFLDDWFIGQADLNDDGMVDVLDLLSFLDQFWVGC